jgi:hypothetical protein
MRRRSTSAFATIVLLAGSLPACGIILGVEPIIIDDIPVDAAQTPTDKPSRRNDAGGSEPEDGSVPSLPPSGRDCARTPDDPACLCDGVRPGEARACNTHPEDGVGACKAGTQTCVAAGGSSAWSPCTGDVGKAPEGCDAVDRDCNGVLGIDEPAPPPPTGAMNCTKTYRCSAPGRGPLYYRVNIGWTNYAGSNTLWTGYASRGDFGTGSQPNGTYRISRDATTATRMGPVDLPTACCPAGCPIDGVYSDGAGQFFTLPP